MFVWSYYVYRIGCFNGINKRKRAYVAWRQVSLSFDFESDLLLWGEIVFNVKRAQHLARYILYFIHHSKTRKVSLTINEHLGYSLPMKG